jgi:hypothetical protein
MTTALERLDSHRSQVPTAITHITAPPTAEIA